MNKIGHFILMQLRMSICCLVSKSCPTLCHPMNCSLSGSSVPGILQARILMGSSRSRDRTHISCFAGRFFISADSSHLGSPRMSIFYIYLGIHLFTYLLSTYYVPGNILEHSTFQMPTSCKKNQSNNHPNK